MMQRILASKDLTAFVLACATGLTLFFRHPFPADDLLMRLIALREPFICEGIRYGYTLFLFTTPYILFSLALSGLYVFALRPRKRVKAVALPEYSYPNQRDTLFLTLGEVHDPRKPIPNDQPYWVNMPERGLFTGIAIFGAIGTGKTSGCMYPLFRPALSRARQAVNFSCALAARRPSASATQPSGFPVSSQKDRRCRTASFRAPPENAELGLGSR
jgi:hypothetical protein